ncbi:MAG: DUF4494 family protein [Clostridia bacterium]
MINDFYYYKGTVRIEEENDKGQIKKRTESYVVKAVSPTEVETKLAEELSGFDYEITGITLLKIVSILG